MAAEVIGEGEIVLSTRNAEALAAFEQTEKAGQKTMTYLEKLYEREEAMKVIRAERAAEKSAKAKEREAAREIKAGEKAAAQAEKQRNREAVAAEKAANREAKAAEKARARETAAAEKAAAKQAKAAESLAAKQASMGTFGGKARALQQNPIVSELETVASMFTQVGGAASQAGILVSSAIRPVALLGTAVGATGLAAAAFPVAAGAAALGAKKMADSAVEARDRLKEMGIAVDQSSSDKLAVYTRANRDLGIAIDQVKVAMGDDIAEELAVFTRIVASGVDDLYRWGQAASEAADTATDWISFGIKPAWQMIGGKLYESLTKTTREINAQILATDKLIERQNKMVKAAADLNNQLEREAQEDEAAGKAERIRQETEAIRKAAEIEQEAAAESARQRAEVWAQFEKENEAIAIRTDRMREYIAALHAIGDIETQMAGLSASAEEVNVEIDGMIAGWEKANDEVLAGKIPLTLSQIADFSVEMAQKIAGAMGDIFGELSERAAEAAEEQVEANEDLLQRQRRIGDQIRALKRDIANEDDRAAKKEKQNRLAALEGERDKAHDELELGRKAAAEHRKMALKAWRGEQAANITEAVMNTGVAVTQALGLPFPLNLIAAGVVGGLGGAQVAMIATQKPPEFPMGLSSPWAGASPDHSVAALIQPNERIVNSRGARDDDDIRRRNEGRGDRGENIFILQAGKREVAAMSSVRGRVKVDPRAGKTTRRRGR